MNQPTIECTRENRDALRRAYDKAVADNQKSFTFQGHELLVGYAKYLLEYLDNVLKR